MTTSWMNPKLHKSDSDAYRQLMLSTDKQVLAVGPARTSKTLLCLRKVFGNHFRHYGYRSAIVRSNSVDLHDSIREDIKFLSRYPLGDPRCPFKAEGGQHFHTLHINGGRCVLGGMNRPGRVLGTHHDIVFYSQAEQSTHEQHQLLKTRCAGTAGNWKNKAGDVLSQFLMDANPERRDHHLLKLKDDGLLRFIEFQFTDNPLFFRKNRWSKVGKDFVEDLDVSLEGVYHDRLFKGIWADPEGAVFEITDTHLLDTLPSDIDRFVWYNAMDFGMAEPSVCLWIGEHADTSDVLIACEFRHSGLDTIDFGNRVRELRKTRESRILRTIIDDDENQQKLLTRNGISCEMARKGPGSIARGLNFIQHALKNTVEGREGGLYIYTGLRDGISPDPKLVRKNKPLDIITELRNLQYKPENKRTGATSDDLPIPGNDHAIAALRYWFDWRDARSGSASFASGGVSRKTRL